jgi:beta-lactamase class A
MALAGSCVVMGILAATIFTGAVTRQIIVSLAAATNLLLTALTGKSVYSIVHIQC